MVSLDSNTAMRTITIGIVAIQGGFNEHRTAFEKCSQQLAVRDNTELRVVEVRCADDVSADLDGVVIPGGESTTMGKFLERGGFGDRLKAFIHSQESKRPHVWGTCAGLILLANNIEGQKHGGQFHLGGIDVTVSRNYFGRQINSFEAPVNVPDTVASSILGSQENISAEFHGVFIRAPAILSCDGEDVCTIATVKRSRHCDNQSEDSVIVGAEQGPIMATAFHPELTDDTRWHKYFIERILADSKKSAS